jgi:hypothetical protein
VDLAGSERALDALDAEGARLFDAASCDCIRTLITRAEQLGGETARLLSLRVGAHLERLRERFTAARGATQRELAQLERREQPLPALRELLARGDVVRVRQRVRRLALSPLRPATLARERSARARGASEYEDALAELVASLALARAVDVVPEHAGPYNPLRIASDLLARMRTVSPIYLTAQLNRLEELASLLELPELPAPAGKVLPRKRRGALKKGA